MRLNFAHFLAGSFAVMACFAAACSQTTDSGDQGSDALSSSPTELDQAAIADLTKAGFAPDEIQAVSDSVTISKELSVKSFVDEANGGNLAPDAFRRESHGKQHGCLRARVDVTTDANVGVFQQGASYPAWIRISNGGAYQKDDKSQHISRGWGIKLMNVDSTPTHTHDFLFITSPEFFIQDIRHYPSFLSSSGDGRFGFIANLLFKMSFAEQTVIFNRLRLQVANLLESPEYSAVPYWYGSETVKYALAPCGSVPPVYPSSVSPPSGAGDDYLADAMDATLTAADPAAGVCYGFFVQRPRQGQDSIDDPTHEWGGDFEQVATITIPSGQQSGGALDYHQNDTECQRMAFEPWNTSSASLPVGKSNWTRKFVYAALNHFRRVDFPQMFPRWLANHDDPSIPANLRKDLANLKNPGAIAPVSVKDTAQPIVDDGFKTLRIVQ